MYIEETDEKHKWRLVLCVCVSLGKKNKLRVYYLSWLRNKILHNDPEVEKKQGWTTVGDLEGCVHYKVGMSLAHPQLSLTHHTVWHLLYIIISKQVLLITLIHL